MTSSKLLLSEYHKLNSNIRKIYVIPKIDLTNKETDYLYQLYKEFILHEIPVNIEIESLSVFAHPKFFWKRITGEKNIVHYHWFECRDIKSIFGLFWKFKWLLFYKLTGGKIVWTVHNKYPHIKKYFSLNKLMRRLLANLADRLHVHCALSVEIMTPLLNVNKKKFFIVNHPTFPSKIISMNESRNNLREIYGLPGIEDKTIFLMFGNIAEYKGITEAVGIFKELHRNQYLIIVGGAKQGDESYLNSLTKQIKNSPNISLVNKIVPDEEVPVIFNAANFVLFNFSDILTSGSVHLALSYNKPVIIPNIGCLTELTGEGIYKFNVDKNSEENLKRVLESL